MKRIDLAQTIQILANVGIIAGLVFLGVELRQNNALMAAEARFNRRVLYNEVWRMTAENGDLAEVFDRAARGETLATAEWRRVNALTMISWLNTAWQFQELSEDSPEMRSSAAFLRAGFANNPNQQRLWENNKPGFDPGFVAWMEENVVGPEPPP